MNKEQRAILAAVNAALADASLPHRFEHHQFWGLNQQYRLDLIHKIICIHCNARMLDVFYPNVPGGTWGHSRRVGIYEGRGWLKRLVDDVVTTVRDEAIS